jgi:hypothetical protein
MNDFSELEAQLKALKPAPLREAFVARVENAMSEPATADTADKIIRPVQFQRKWLIGLGLAAAAALLLLVRVNFQTPQTEKRVAGSKPLPTVAPVESSRRTLPNEFLPTGSTQVVYHQHDEGLLFAQNSEQPMRRLRSITQETLQWKNPATGASLSVSYPSEQVELVPISAQ